jgi:hypothetical protein
LLAYWLTTAIQTRRTKALVDRLSVAELSTTNAAGGSRIKSHSLLRMYFVLLDEFVPLGMA